ncbi:MAG: FlhB domain protein [Thermoanaerobacterales bacterium 50_218]|nr:MAG: FlhB domain protein [Thermoanaerobacterales bacterium 50_218]HAA90218.1 FhlB domain-containing protein [Peptococcaceae bacterium]
MERDDRGYQKLAVALRYRQNEDNAPRVVATGRGELAWRIIREAEKHGIPLYEDPQLVTLLSKLPLGTEIPPELYEAVAKVLAFVYTLDLRKSRPE